MRIGCLGAARIAPPALIWPAKMRGGAVLQTIAARDPDRAAAFAEAHGFARHDKDYAAVIAAPDVELIYNPLPINLHAEWTIRALEAGKHVLCEKPFAMNLEEAKAMVAAARKADRRLIEAFHYRFHPGFAQLLSWVRDGRIGAIQSLEGRFTVPIADRGGDEIRHLPETGGGAFMDLGCYPLSWTLAVMQAGPTAVRAEAQLTPRGVDEVMRAELDFASGAKARLEASMAKDAGFAAWFKIVGERGEISFTNPLAPQLGSRLALTVDGVENVVPVGRIATYLYQLDAVIEALENGTETPMEGETILRQQSALDAVYRGAGLEGLRWR